MSKERLARVAGAHVLSDRILDVLAVERVLKLGGEDRDAIQEEHEIEAVLVLHAVAELADRREEIRRMEASRLLVQPARRTEIGELEFAARILDALPDHVDR